MSAPPGEAGRGAVLAWLAERLVALRPGHPLRVAIDGVDGAGKTTFADDLAAPVVAAGRPALRATVDRFHNPRDERYRRGRHSPEGYFRDSFDYGRVRSLLLDPLGPGGDRRIRRHAFDHRSDAPDLAPVETSPRDAVLLFDGIFLQRPELRAGFDVCVFLAVDFAITFRRMAGRDGGDPDAGAPGNARYLEGQRLYLTRCRPAELADVLIDNDDPLHPRVLRAPAGRAGA